MKPSHICVHGTYPFEDEPNKWSRCHDITHEEAGELICADDELLEHEYMWLNKGFVVVDHEGPLLSDARIKKGMQAVYLHDGQYSVIERIAD